MDSLYIGDFILSIYGFSVYRGFYSLYICFPICTLRGNTPPPLPPPKEPSFVSPPPEGHGRCSAAAGMAQRPGSRWASCLLRRSATALALPSRTLGSEDELTACEGKDLDRVLGSGGKCGPRLERKLHSWLKTWINTTQSAGCSEASVELQSWRLIGF